MKRLFFVLPLFAVIMMTARCVPPKESGIEFYGATWQEVLTKAKSLHKPIFLDIYASWCGPCKMLKRETFPDKNVAAYFNTHFVNASFDGEKGDGVMLANKFQIAGYPALFILDENGNVVQMSMGFLQPDELVQFAKNSLKGK